MKVAFYMNCVSAHQLPLAKEVAELVGPENFCYVDAGEKSESAQCAETQGLRFKVQRVGEAVAEAATVQGEEAREWIETADVMLTGMRDLELFERRAKKGLKTYYASERWFKPVEIGVGGRCRVVIPGCLRMVVPGYRRMVKRFVKWANEDPGARVLAIGPWAKKDFLRMGLRAEKIVDWGYFVEKGREGLKSEGVENAARGRAGNGKLRILWCGRMLGLKRVETIIRAVARIREAGRGKRDEVRLTLVGDGSEKGRLVRLAERVEKRGGGGQWNLSPSIAFLPSQPMEKVRELMREHDLFVFPSNGYEGWGAVVSEALEEGMRVLASYECGAGPTLLPRERLFHSGDWKGLAQLIEKEMRGELPPCSIGEWTAKAAAKRLVGALGIDRC